MGEGNHLPETGSAGTLRGRWMLIFGGTAAAVVATGLLMQYVRGTATQAAAETPAATKPAPKKELLARVGNESISYDAVAEEAVKRYGREVLDDLIHRLIIQQACEKNKISVSEQEITDEISRIAKRFNLDPAQWLQMLQAERNISPLQYRQSVIFPMIALKKLAGEEVEVTERDIKEAFVRNYGPRVKARMIMYDNQRRAQEGWEKVKKNPELFEDIASKESVDPGSRALGGQIPPIQRFSNNEYLENLEKEAFKLKKDEISGVIEVSPTRRFVILKCEGRTEPVVTDIEQVKDSLYDELKESKIQAEVAKIFDQIKKETIVDNYLAQTSNRPERTASATGTQGTVQPASGTQTKTGSTGTRPSKAANGSTPASRN